MNQLALIALKERDPSPSVVLAERELPQPRKQCIVCGGEPAVPAYGNVGIECDAIARTADWNR